MPASRIAICSLLLLLVLLCAARPAHADATLFLGSAWEPSSRGARGAALGFSLLVVGFEFEYASTSEDADEGAPSLRTGMANVFVQTPVAIAGVQPYLTAGGGGYRERLGDQSETNVGMNVGGGVKVSLAGPLRVRLDYRRLALGGAPLHARVHRVYAGLNVRF